MYPLPGFPANTLQCRQTLHTFSELVDAAQQLRAALRQHGTRCQPVADPPGRLFAAERCARACHGRDDRARADGRRVRAALCHGERCRQLASGRGRLPAVQLLARRLPRRDRQARRGRGAFRAAPRAAQPRRAAVRRVRPAHRAPAGQLAPDGPERLAGQHHADAATQRYPGSLHRRPVCDGPDLEPDDPRTGDRRRRYQHLCRRRRCSDSPITATSNVPCPSTAAMPKQRSASSSAKMSTMARWWPGCSAKVWIPLLRRRTNF